MKPILTTALLFTLISVIFTNQRFAQQSAGWDLVWSDEFEYDGLPDPTKWRYEIGHIRNWESQYYTGPRLENIRVKNGKLYIIGQKEQYPNEFYVSGSSDWRKAFSTAGYTSGCIITEGLHSWKFGRIEVRARLPKGQGIWPAIWMMGEDRSQVGWPHCGEIDIMEFIGTEPENIYGTVHFPGKEGETYNSNGAKTQSKSLSGKFHVYAIEWTKESIDFFLDNKKYHSFPLEMAESEDGNPFRKPHYLLINLAMGANWPGPIDDAVLPQEFIIDYVRVYQRP